MARYTNAINTLQARTILSVINRYTKPIETKTDVEKVAVLAVKICRDKFPSVFVKEEEKAYIAFSLSATAKTAVKNGTLKVLDYIAILAGAKENNEESIKDFGAFGDLYEVLIRCAFLRKISLVTWSALSVKAIDTADIVSKKFGIVEVGHNGKTFSHGTLFDYMEGEYTSVVYGMFTEEDKTEVYNLCKEKEYDKAIEYVCSYSVYWSDKYSFQNDMDNLTSGKGITKKGENIQVVYNAGKQKAFSDAIENGIFETLFETLNG